jgi:hypothetical protein
MPQRSVSRRIRCASGAIACQLRLLAGQEHGRTIPLTDLVKRTHLLPTISTTRTVAVAVAGVRNSND